MFRLFASLSMIFFIALSGSLVADCCQSAEVSLGWRRDDLNWKMNHVDSSYVCGHANSRIHFKDINSYTLSGKFKWVDRFYYIRLTGDYGLTDKGRARERFQIKSPWLYYPIGVETSDPVKRRSEVYDFDIAAGYPFTFLCSRLSFVPLVGFSFHRQHIRVKEDRDDSYSSSSSSSSYSYYDSYYSSSYSRSSSSFFRSHSSSAFYVSSSNPFRFSPSSDPFSSHSESNIADSLGLYNPNRTTNFRFTWYGFYLGADIAYALDGDWTLFTEFEGHFLNNCHRKRKSWTGVYFVDDYHKKGWAYGYNSVVGLTYCLGNCWYSILSIDYKWWKGDSKNPTDVIHWQSVGVNLGLGYMF